MPETNEKKVVFTTIAGLFGIAVILLLVNLLSPTDNKVTKVNPETLERKEEIEPPKEELSNVETEFVVQKGEGDQIATKELGVSIIVKNITDAYSFEIPGDWFVAPTRRNIKGVDVYNSDRSCEIGVAFLEHIGPVNTPEKLVGEPLKPEDYDGYTKSKTITDVTLGPYPGKKAVWELTDSTIRVNTYFSGQSRIFSVRGNGKCPRVERYIDTVLDSVKFNVL